VRNVPTERVTACPVYTELFVKNILDLSGMQDTCAILYWHIWPVCAT